jgi:hypothetical protein
MIRKIFCICIVAAAMAATSVNAKSVVNYTPLPKKSAQMLIAACLPDGASCDKGADCCTNNCNSTHHKCGR